MSISFSWLLVANWTLKSRRGDRRRFEKVCIHTVTKWITSPTRKPLPLSIVEPNMIRCDAKYANIMYTCCVDMDLEHSVGPRMYKFMCVLCHSEMHPHLCPFHIRSCTLPYLLQSEYRCCLRCYASFMRSCPNTS